MAAQQVRLDAIAEDVSNVDTDGYKRQRVAFRELVYTAAGVGSGKGVGIGAGASATIIGRTGGQGALGTSGNPLDVALQGPGFLRVTRADGSTAYTRGGQLQIDGRGRLATAQGDLASPVISIPTGTDPKDVSIGPDGVVAVKDKKVGKLTIEEVGAPDAMRSVGDGLFATSAASGTAKAAANTTIEQGQIEGSNVDPADSMVDMMDAQRSYSLASKAVQMQDQLLEIANGIKK